MLFLTNLFHKCIGFVQTFYDSTNKVRQFIITTVGIANYIFDFRDDGTCDFLVFLDVYKFVSNVFIICFQSIVVIVNFLDVLLILNSFTC